MGLASADFSSNSTNSLTKNQINSESLSTATNSSSEEFAITDSTIRAWQYFLAADLVSQWRSLPVEEWDISAIFPEFNPELKRGNSLLLTRLSDSKTSNNSFLDTLDTEFNEIYQQPLKYFSNSGIIKWLIPATAKLTNYLTKYIQSCLEQLEVNLDNLRPRLHQNIQIYFYSLNGGTTSASACLNSLSEKLHCLAQEYEMQWQESLYKSNASRHSFENLSAQVSRLLEFSKQQKAESALNALRLTYKYQLSGQLYNAACKLLKSLSDQVQERILMLNEVDRFLERLQSEYVQQHPLLPVTAAFLKHYLSPRIEANQFLKEIEQWANNTMSEWASLEVVEISRIKQEILIRLQPVCWDFYCECYQVERKLSSSNFTDLSR